MHLFVLNKKSNWKQGAAEHVLQNPDELHDMTACVQGDGGKVGDAACWLWQMDSWVALGLCADADEGGIPLRSIWRQRLSLWKHAESKAAVSLTSLMRAVRVDKRMQSAPMSRGFSGLTSPIFKENGPTHCWKSSLFFLKQPYWVSNCEELFAELCG